MKKIFFYIIIASLLVVSGCDKNKTPKIFIEESLDSLLSNFIKDNPNDHIYSILFYNKNEKQFMEITSFGKLYYSKLVDKVFYKDGKLICYYSINRSWADSLLNIPASLLCTDSLKKYDDLSTGLIDYEGPLNTRTNSMVEGVFPTIQTTIVDSKVATALASKTFLEKVFLLHELFSVEGRGVIADCKSRHLYDLSRMMDKDFALAAIKDDELWESIRHHREIFTSISGMDYTPDIRRRIVLVPREDIRSAWEADYKSMCSSMIFGEKPSFIELIENMKVLEDRFHRF